MKMRYVLLGLNLKDMKMIQIGIQVKIEMRQ